MGTSTSLSDLCAHHVREVSDNFDFLQHLCDVAIDIAGLITYTSSIAIDRARRGTLAIALQVRVE